MQIVFNILFNAALVILVALSFQLIYQTTKFFHIAHAVIISLGAYLTYCFYIELNLSIFIAIPVAIILSTIIGVLIEVAIYRRFRERNTQPFLIMIASLGIYTVLQNIISLIWQDDTKSFRFNEIRTNRFMGAFITNEQLITIISSIFVFSIAVVLIKKTTIGKKIQAVSSNETLSNIIGIDSNNTILWSFIIGSAIASFAGILSAANTDITPTMGFNLLLYCMVAMIIGGIGSYVGIIWGALFLSIAQQLGAYYIDSKWMDAIAYTILILFLIWRPLGFSGKRLKKVEI
jgi:branched-chain amino acid transport system permease protein